MREIKIHFTRNRKGKIFSRAIMWYDKVNFSHCAIELNLKKINTQVIYHSSLEGGVNFYNKDLFLEKNEIVDTYTIHLEEKEYRSILKGLIESCGIEYALMQNIGIVLVDITRRIGINVKNPWKKGYNCSELVYRYIILNKYPTEIHDPELIKPSEIKNILNNKR